ncbi:MAG TPA: 5'-nucleotidase C-terminal domain-containing protein, partial [Kiritimatiellia bacterium]
KNRGGIQFMGAYGLDFDVQRQNGESQVTNLRLPDGTPLHARKRFRVAANSYVLASGGTRFPATRRIADEPESRLELTTLDTRSVVIDYIKRHSPLNLTDIMGEQKP